MLKIWEWKKKGKGKRGKGRHEGEGAQVINNTSRMYQDWERGMFSIDPEI